LWLQLEPQLFLHCGEQRWIVRQRVARTPTEREDEVKAADQSRVVHDDPAGCGCECSGQQRQWNAACANGGVTSGDPAQRKVDTVERLEHQARTSNVGFAVRRRSAQPGAQLTVSAGDTQRINSDRTAFRVHPQLESISEQRLRHRRELIGRGSAGVNRLDVEPVLVNPHRTAHDLLFRQAPDRANDRSERVVPDQQAARPVAERARFDGCVCFDGRDVKGGRLRVQAPDDPRQQDDRTTSH
jgi:hypothetical protein